MAAITPLALKEIEALGPEYLGRTWQEDAFDRRNLPECMLGWQTAGRISRQHVKTPFRLSEAHRSSRRSTAVELATPREAAIPRGWQGKPRAPRA